MKIYSVYIDSTSQTHYFSTKSLANKFNKTLKQSGISIWEINDIVLDEQTIELPSGFKVKLSEDYAIKPIIKQEEDDREIGDQHVWRYNKDGKLYRVYLVTPRMKTGGKFYEAEPYPQGIDNGQTKIRNLKDLNDFVKVGRR